MAHDGFVHDHQSFGCEAPPRSSKGFQGVEGPRCSLDTVTGMRDKGDVGFQRDNQYFRGSVQRGHLVSDFHLWVVPELVSIRGEQYHAECLGSNDQLFATHLSKV